MIASHVAREQITIDNTVGGKTLTVTNITGRVRYVEIQVLTAQIRVTHDGSTAPVAATTGNLWNPGDIKRVWGPGNLQNLKFIRESTTNATIVVDYWGER